MTKHTAIDLFSVAGGLTLGLHDAAIDTVAAFEIDSAATETYKSNFPDVELCVQDVRDVDFSAFAGEVDIVAGGPPCQPFSVAGNQRAQMDTRDCVPEFVRAVREIRPKMFMMENVFGLATQRHSGYLDGVVAELEAAGYRVSHGVLDAADYGVPQNRRRLFIIGGRQCDVSLPTPTHGADLTPQLAAGRALSGAPSDAPNRAKVTYAKQPVLRPSPFAGMLVNGGGRPIDLSLPAQTIPASAGGNRTPILDVDGVLVEYHQHLADGGKPRSGLVQGLRRLTVRRARCLPAFSDSFEFTGKQSHATGR